MRPRDRPTERTGSMGEPPEEPIVIEMSMDGPDEAGANPRSPSPEYENLEVPEVLMDEAEAEEEMNKNKNPEAPGPRSPGQGPRERSPVLNAYYTQNFRPRQVAKFPTVTQVTEGKKRSKEEEAQGARRGSQRRQSNSQERQDPVAQGDKGMTRSQDAICDCSICQGWT